MKKITIILSILFFFDSLQAQSKFIIDRISRPIQVDGFLIEWQAENAQTFPIHYNLSLIWEAANSISGLVGYLRFESPDTLPSISISLSSGKGNTHYNLIFSSHDTIADNPFYSFNIEVIESQHSLTAEWLIPWDSLAVDTNKKYEVNLRVQNSQKTEIINFLFIGEPYLEKTKNTFTSRIQLQLFSILVLTILFILVQKRARRQKKS